MRMKDHLNLRYKGSAVDDGRMDAYEVAGNIIAFTDFLSCVSKVAYGCDAKLNTQVSAFKRGSFSVQFVLDYGGLLTALFGPVSSPKDLYDLIVGCFDCWKHLNGTLPTKIINNGDGSIAVENNHGVVNYFSNTVINIVQIPEAAKAAERFVKHAVSDGVSSVHIEHGDNEIVSANSEEARFFGIVIPAIKDQQNHSNVTGRRLFKVKTPDLLGKSKWEVIFDGKTESVKITHNDWVESYHKRSFSILPHDSLDASFSQEIIYDNDGQILANTIELTYIHNVVSPSNNFEMDI